MKPRRRLRHNVAVAVVGFRLERVATVTVIPTRQLSTMAAVCVRLHLQWVVSAVFTTIVRLVAFTDTTIRRHPLLRVAMVTATPAAELATLTIVPGVNTDWFARGHCGSGVSIVRRSTRIRRWQRRDGGATVAVVTADEAVHFHSVFHNLLDLVTYTGATRFDFFGTAMNIRCLLK